MSIKSKHEDPQLEKVSKQSVEHCFRSSYLAYVGANDFVQIKSPVPSKSIIVCALFLALPSHVS